MVGKVMIERLFRAADRGVRVRLLLDDVGTRPSDAVLLAIDSHPNIEVRMFNPVAMRSLRMLGMVADFARINKRMHNKSLHRRRAGRDRRRPQYRRRILSRRMRREFCRSRRGGHRAGGEGGVRRNSIFTGIIELRFRSPRFRDKTRRPSSSPRSARRSIAHDKTATAFRLCGHRARQRVCPTAPEPRADLVVGTGHDRARSSRQGAHLLRKDRHASRAAASRGRRSHETRAVPRLALLRAGKGGRRPAGRRAPARTARGRDHQLAGVHRRRAGSLRIPALPQSRCSRPASNSMRSSRPPAPAASSGGFREPAGSSSASLHAKTFAFDRRIGFIGSYNLDPRSSKLNTEMGVLFDCPAAGEASARGDRARSRPQRVSRGTRWQSPRVGDARG